MRLPSLREAAFFVLCAGALGWCFSDVGSDRVAVERSPSAAPGLLGERCASSAVPLARDIGGQLGSPERFDPQVRPASAVGEEVQPAAPAAAQVVPISITLVTQEIAPDSYVWNIRQSGSRIELVGTGSMRLRFASNETLDNLEIEANGQPFRAYTGVNPSQGSVLELELSLQPGQTHALLIKRKNGDSTNPFRIYLVVPTNDNDVLREPLIAAISNNAYRAPVPLAEFRQAIRVYDGYLRMSGKRVVPGSNLRFVLFRKLPSPPRNEFVAVSDAKFTSLATSDGKWEAETSLDLPPVEDANESFVVLAKASLGDGRHRFSANAVDRLQVGGKPKDPPATTKAPQILVDADGRPAAPAGKAPDIYRLRGKQFRVQASVDGGQDLINDLQVVLFLNNAMQEIEMKKDDGSWTASVGVPADTDYDVQTAVALGNRIVGQLSPVAKVSVRTRGPRVQSVNQLTATLESIRVTFDEPIQPLPREALNADALKEIFQLKVEKEGSSVIAPKVDPLPTFDAATRSITIYYDPKQIDPGNYKFTVKKQPGDQELKDLFGNGLEEEYTERLFRAIGAEEPLTTPGIPGPTGPHVEFSEYTRPRPVINGFNPSDHVETRVSRLYYFRDAHRVAQIVNREAKSFNRAAVLMQEQLASKARQIADQATDDRRAKERRSVQAATKTREAERELQEAEARASSAASQAAQAAADQQRLDTALRNRPPERTDQEQAALQAQADHVKNAVTQLERVAESARRTAESAYNRVQSLRDAEAAASEQWQAAIAVEDRAREEQFRREVAAAHADPDTYTPGKPESEDPVRQVSVSVVGEGLIQLRGPLKGINIIRTMVNQIDAPVGQVRVAVHTVQINGEKGDRMEQVAGKIQRYIDHSRFLTLQSAEMLRKAIVQVAAQRAIELGDVAGMTQEERDRKYLYSFFGEDFIRELEVMDSEFLKTGNKLLSIHSMDSTSLASAMFIMALAKNSTRMQILQTFDGLLAGELPMAEQNYFEAGLTCDGKYRLFDKHCKRDDFQLLSQNARFQSIRGLFDAEITADDTMTPIQREFVRLAQIFKSRLIVEMELKQRVMERSVIEERLGDREKELRESLQRERIAQDELGKAQAARRDAHKNALAAAQQIQSLAREANVRANEVQAAAAEVQQAIRKVVDPVIEGAISGIAGTQEGTSAEMTTRLNEIRERGRRSLAEPLGPNDSSGLRIRKIVEEVRGAAGLKALDPKEDACIFAEGNLVVPLTVSPAGELRIDIPRRIEQLLKPAGPEALARARAPAEKLKQYLSLQLNQAIARSKKIKQELSNFNYDEENGKRLAEANETLETIGDRANREHKELDDLIRAGQMFEQYLLVAKQVVTSISAASDAMRRILTEMAKPDADFQCVYEQWLPIEAKILQDLTDDFRKSYEEQFAAARNSFQSLLQVNLDYQFARQNAEASRRPLDHKKFLDMLVDDMEDKYIELLEGTRAHTANIDAYIKRLMTSLDDDFNTQFYYPTFRKVREASQFWDVQMGQVETTNVLANNRAFAKVTPQATMEFDLPKRDIVIAEAIDGAKAMIDDVGALAQDPTFLAMAKLNGGQPTSSPVAGASGGFSTVRNVLPGLSTDTAEAVLGQQGPGGVQFGAALEGLIPDPAIYKFETGTGWEIRPVIQPDGQAVVFHFNYMYSTNIREPVRADEKHLGRVKRHFVDTDVQLSNYELREVSRYTVALKAARTSRGVPLFEDIPVAGVLFRPLPSAESSLQQNIIMSQATIFPTLFDLMGLRWAPVVADLDPLRLSNDEFIVRNRRRALMNRVFDHSSSQVDEFLRIPEAERRMDLYRSQETIPSVHPNGYSGPGANLRDSQLQEGYSPTDRPQTQFVPGQSPEGSPLRPQRPLWQPPAASTLDLPQGGAESGSGSRLNGSGPGVIEQPPPQFIGPAVEPVPAPSPDSNGRASSPRPAEAGEVNRTSYLQPATRTPLPQAASQSQRRPTPLPLGPAELRRLPRPEDNARSN